MESSTIITIAIALAGALGWFAVKRPGVVIRRFESINFAYLTVALFCIGYLFGQSNGIDAVAELLDDHTLRAKARDTVLGTRGPFFALWVFLGGQAVLYAWLWLARIVREDDMRKPHEKEQEK